MGANALAPASFADSGCEGEICREPRLYNWMRPPQDSRRSAPVFGRREFLIGTIGAAAVGPAIWAATRDADVPSSSPRPGPVSDETEFVTRLLKQSFEKGNPVDAGDKVYGIAGDLRISGIRGPTIRSLRLRQLAPANGRKTLHFDNCDGVRIDGLQIDRGGVRGAGDLNSAAGLWIEGGAGHDVRNVEVTGHGTGNGIAIWSTADSRFDHLQVSDMQYDAPNATDDILQGIWLNRTSDCVVTNAVVSNLTGNADRRFPARFTRGIAAGGNHRLRIINPQVKDVDQGIDLTGSEGNLQCTVSGGRTLRCTTAGVKLANSAIECRVLDHVDESAGMFGFHATGPAEPNLDNKIQNCDFLRCTAKNPGSIHFPFPDRAPKGACGFLIWSGDYDPGYPKGIRFIDCYAEDRQPAKSMRYGYYCGVKSDVGARAQNQLIDCLSDGYLVSAKGGTWG